MSDIINDLLESEEFYKLMQAYRHAPVAPQANVVAAFEEVKKYIRYAVGYSGVSRPHFRCPDCGKCAVDEDGCCRSCGADADVRLMKAESSRPPAQWEPIETIPKDRWVWVYSRKSRSQMVTAYRWDESHGQWFSGLGWWYEIDQYFTHWTDILGQPPSPPSASSLAPSEKEP